MNLKKSIFLLILVAGVQYANAYEVDTHARITDNAYVQSNLSQAELLGALGFVGTMSLGGLESGFTNYYYEIVNNSLVKREALAGTKKNMPDYKKDTYKYLNSRGWLIRGAIREDDVLKYDDPNYGVINTVRVVNHFYDPLNNEPLSSLIRL